MTIRDPAGSSGHARIFLGPAFAGTGLAGAELTTTGGLAGVALNGTGLTRPAFVGKASRTVEGETGIKERG